MTVRDNTAFMYSETHYTFFEDKEKTNAHNNASFTSAIPARFPPHPDFPRYTYRQPLSESQWLPLDAAQQRQLPCSPTHLIVATIHRLYALVANQGYWSTLLLPQPLDKIQHILAVAAHEVCVPVLAPSPRVDGAPSHGAHSSASGPPATVAAAPSTAERWQRRVVVAMTVMQMSMDPSSPDSSYYLYIYGTRTDGSCLESMLFHAMHDRQVIPLNGCPTHLMLDDRLDDDGHLFALVSCLDGRTHRWVFESQQSEFTAVIPNGGVQTTRIDPILRHLSQIPGAAILCLTWYATDQYTVVAAGTVDEMLHIGIENRCNESEYGGPVADPWTLLRVPLANLVTAVQFFTDCTLPKRASGEESALSIAQASQSAYSLALTATDTRAVHLVATCANEATLLFDNLHLLATATTPIPPAVPLPQILPESHLHDSVTTVCCFDVDYNGIREVITGSYGQKLIIYERAADHTFQIKWKRGFSYPIFGIHLHDVNQDGVDELVVVTMRGIHVLQPNLYFIRELVATRLNQTPAL
ncbi:hypothetical protein H4R35_000928 [Dimargaris xerosporica]|nr:hypothetical protein H4R35_000928 [Dimargaris xerosporica]